MGLLEKCKLLLPMEDRFLAAAQRVLDNGAGDSGASVPLRPHQMPALMGFRDYLTDLATRPGGVVDPPFCRIVLPPRTGKTVVAGELIFQTGLRATLRKKHKIHSRFDPPLVMTCEEPPDFAPIVCRFASPDGGLR